MSITFLKGKLSLLHYSYFNFLDSVGQMVDESNTRLMRDYVLETSHVENEG